ncbi:MAG TPA: glycosyltransferase family 87 protein [Puia sp.]|nr:glycosyltransferase family 87 protein [Puia sp.]
MPGFRRYLCFLPLLLTVAFGLYRSISAPPSDFAGYYYGSRALIHRNYPGAYEMVQLNDRIAADGYRDVLVSYAPFPPFTSLVFAPFLLWPMGVAKVLFNCLGIGLFAFSLGRITSFLSTPDWLIVLLPVVFFIPLLNNPGFGQSYLLLFALLAEGYLAYRRGQRILFSLLWATAILFKLFPAFLFFYLLLRRRYRDTAYLAVGCVFLLLLSAVINGVEAWTFYVATIVPRLNHGELNDSFTYVFQSGYMLLKRTFCYDRLLNPYPVADNPWLFTMGVALFKSLILTPAVCLTIAASATTRNPIIRERDDFLPFGIWVAAATLISPNGSSYSLVLLIFPLLALARLSHPVFSSGPSRYMIAAALLLAIACAIPVTRLGALPPWAQFPRLYLLLLFYVVLCRLQCPRRSLPLFITLTALFFALDLPGNLPQKDASSYALTVEAHLFIDGFGVRNNRLVYTWRDGGGSHEEFTSFPVHSLTNDGVSLRDNQIWYAGKQLTASSDRKASPALVNGDLIIYLSDKHRGFEFFTLREIRTDAASPDVGAIPGSSR